MLVSQGAIRMESFEGITKRHIRERVWTFMTERNIARNPIPIFNRIPNFEGAGKCGNRITTLTPFLNARVIKVDPDKPLEDIRFLSLVFRKELLVPSPCLQNGLFNLLWNDGDDDLVTLRKKTSYEEIKKLSSPFDPNYKRKVDVIVSGAVAVSLTGRRIGKGEGFSDLEYGIMKHLNLTHKNTVVIAVVHDCQVFDELPHHLFQEYDVPVDYIITPSLVINTNHSLPKPEGIYWNKLSEQKIRQIWHLLPEEKISQKEINEQSTRFIPKQPSQFEGYNKGRGYISRPKTQRGRNLHNYNNMEQRTSYDSKNKSQYSYNNYPKEKKIPYENQSCNLSQFENENGHLHVTISVDKKNHVINRTVEESRELDRVGDANEEIKENEKAENNFTIYVGWIPKDCRITDLREELKKRNVEPSYIAWKGFDYAFLDFKNSILDVNEILELLKDLTVKGKTLKVNHKQYATDKNYQSNSRKKDNDRKTLNRDNSLIDSPKKTEQSSNLKKFTKDSSIGAESHKETANDSNAEKSAKDNFQADLRDKCNSKRKNLTKVNNLAADSPETTRPTTECQKDEIKNVNKRVTLEACEPQIKQCSKSSSNVEMQNQNTEDNQNNGDGWGSVDDSVEAEYEWK